MDTVPTLGDVLRSPSLSLRVHLPGDPDRQVRWVATSELPDPTPFLEGGEILLTTGLTTGEWDTEWEAFAARLAGSGVVALGLGIGLTHPDVPAALERAALTVGLALFAVPRPVPFVAVTRAVGRLVEQEEQRALRSAADTQRRLTRASVAVDGPAAILRTLATIVDGAAQVCGPDGAGLDPAVVARLRTAGLRGSHSESGPAGSKIVQPLGLHGSPRGYLLVTGPRPWDAGHRGAVATAVALLSLDAERRADALAAAREIRSGALSLLLAGATGPALALLDLRAAAAGPVHADGRFHVVRVRGRGVLDSLEDWAAGEPRVLLVATSANEAGPHEVAADVTAVVLLGEDPNCADALQGGVPGPSARGNPGCGGPGRGAGPAGEGSGHVAVTDARPWYLRDARAGLGRLVRSDWRVGIGAPQALADAAASDAAAVAALARATPERPVARWDDVVDGGLAAMLRGPGGEAFARAVLGELAGPGHDELNATLDQFHTHHGQITLVAASLGVHRNTVRRRLSQIEAITGRSLDTPRDRAELWVAAQVISESRRS